MKGLEKDLRILCKDISSISKSVKGGVCTNWLTLWKLWKKYIKQMSNALKIKYKKLKP